MSSPPPFEDHQLSQSDVFDTPAPCPKRKTQTPDPSSLELLSHQLIVYFSECLSISLHPSAASLLSHQFCSRPPADADDDLILDDPTECEIDESKLNRFIQSVLEIGNVKEIDHGTANRIIVSLENENQENQVFATSKKTGVQTREHVQGIVRDRASLFELASKNIRTRVFDVYRDYKKYIWSPQNNKLILSPTPPSLLPTPQAFRDVYVQRFYQIVQRLQQHSKVAWWSAVDSFSHLPHSGGAKVTVHPVECALGNKGEQSLVGYVTRKCDAVSGPYWEIEDLLQSVAIDVSECEFEASFFVDSNVVVALGRMAEEGDIFRVSQMTHPAREEGDDGIERAMGSRVIGGEEAEEDDDINYMKNKNVLGHSKMGHNKILEESESYDSHLSAADLLTSLASGGVKAIWLVFGICLLDKQAVIEKIYNGVVKMLEKEDVYIVGIILTGDFNSRPACSAKDFSEAFDDLWDTLATLLRSRVDGKGGGRELKVVLVPGPSDPGPAFLPKMNLPPCLIGSKLTKSEKERELILKINDDINIQIISSSNPSRLRCLTRDLLVARSDLLSDLTGEFCLHTPLKQKHLPTREELEEYVPPLILGQSHVYPVSPLLPSLKIAPDLDFALRLVALPDVVILSDLSPAYVRHYEERIYICSPGDVRLGEMLVYDMTKQTVEVEAVE